MTTAIAALCMLFLACDPEDPTPESSESVKIEVAVRYLDPCDDSLGVSAMEPLIPLDDLALDHPRVALNAQHWEALSSAMAQFGEVECPSLEPTRSTYRVTVQTKGVVPDGRVRVRVSVGRMHSNGCEFGDPIVANATFRAQDPRRPSVDVWTDTVVAAMTNAVLQLPQHRLVAVPPYRTSVTLIPVHDGTEHARNEAARVTGCIANWTARSVESSTSAHEMQWRLHFEADREIQDREAVDCVARSARSLMTLRPCPPQSGPPDVVADYEGRAVRIIWP